MDDAKKKQMKVQWREQQRKAAMAALPLPICELKALFDMLDEDLPLKGCDHTRALTQVWLTSRNHDPAPVFAWLDTQGGYCDCEILANVEEKVDDASRE